MNILTSLLFTLLSISWAFAFDTSSLKSGDVLLISLNCYECRVIESETNSPYSHSGIVIKNELGEIKIAQSLTGIALYSFQQFSKYKTPGTSIAVYRPHELSNLSSKEELTIDQQMLKVFNEQFKGLPFDKRYLWDNYNSEGLELLYCSEFVAKFLDRFLSNPTIPFPLSYKKNWVYWLQYFKGDIPDGVLGNSPASLSYDERLNFIGNL